MNSVFVFIALGALLLIPTTNFAFAQVSDFYWSETTSWVAPGTGGNVFSADAATKTVGQVTGGGFNRIDDVELDQINAKLFWNNWASGSGTSSAAEGIYSSNLDGSGQTQVAGSTESSSSATGAAGHHGIFLDTNNQVIFFTRGVSYAGHELARVDMNGANYQQLDSATWFPSGIVLSSSNLVYWGAPGISTGGAINTVNSDGTGVVLNVVPHTDGLGRSLAFDESKGLIFYSSFDVSGPCCSHPTGIGPSTGGGIWVYDISSGIATQVLSDPDTGIPDVELDTVNMIIYWTDFARGEIRSASYDAAGNLGQFTVELNGLSNPYGLALAFAQGIGGEILPIDTTALLLASTQSISMWMIPIAISAVGLGIVLVRRK